MSSTVHPGTRFFLQVHEVSALQRFVPIDFVGLSENDLPGFWRDALGSLGFPGFCRVPRAEATTTVKMGYPADGITAHCPETTKLLKTTTIRFRDAKQVALVLAAVVKGRTVVFGVAHLASGHDKEKLREAQMNELCGIMKSTAADVDACACVLLGDCNASPYPVDADGLRVEPLAMTAAAAHGFKIQCPALTTPPAAFCTEIATSSKVRVKNRDGETKFEDKTAWNDFCLTWSPPGRAPPRLLRYLMPPPKNPWSMMATVASDHSLLLLTLDIAGENVTVLFWNLLASHLADEMQGHVYPCIAPESQAAEAAAVKAEPRRQFKYDVGEPAEVLEAPHALPVRGPALIAATSGAYLNSIADEAEALSLPEDEVIASRAREWRDCTK